MASQYEIWKASLFESPSRAWESILRNYRYSHHHARSLAIFAIVAEPFYYFLWRYLEPESYETLLLRSLGALLCVPLLFARDWMRRGLEPVLAIVFLVAATYCLPFAFCFLLLKNASLIAEPFDTPIIWPMQYAISLMLLVLLFPSGVLASMLFLVATLAAWLAFWTTGGHSTSEVVRMFWHMMPVYLFILASGTLFNVKREVIDQAKLRAMSNVTNNIAHELRTPLLAMKALAQGIGMHLPGLIRAYDLGIANGLKIEPIRKRQLERMRTSLREIEVETDYSNVIIDRLLINTTERPFEQHPFEDFTAQSCVIDAIHRYPFAGGHERDMISIDLDRNFMIHAPPILIVHVLFNLMKNGIYYVQKAGKGDLTVRLVTNQRFADSIVVEDTGTGIAPQNLRRIFERFYTTSETAHSSGIGLSFCKAVMEGLGGSITCESEIGVYTRFTLTFPRPQHA
jgi:two-component system CAI-1 autoinducer sensor kinase/phosphatase CqsS